MSSPIKGSLAKDRLGVPSVIFFVISAAAPLTIVAGVVTTGFAATGIIGIPFAFITIAVILTLFSVGYVAMSRHISNAGAFYTYVSHGLGRPLGVGAAWMALVAYNALQIGLYGIIGFAAQGPLNRIFGVSEEWSAENWWIIALGLWAIVAILGVLRVDINGKVLAVLLCAEILIVLIYDFGYLTQPAASGLALDTLDPSNLFVSGVGAVLVLTLLGFTGFESSVVFSEESKNPKRTIALATYISVAIIGVTYAISSWAMSVATGPDKIVESSATSGPFLIFELASTRLPAVLVDLGGVLFATSVLAAAISFHNTVARYTFALGRERVFPGFFSATGRRTGAPIAGSLLQSVVGLVVIVLYALNGLDPVFQLMFWIGTSGGFGILTLLLLTSVSVVAFFARNPNGENLWRRVIAPGLSIPILATVVYFAVSNFELLLAVPPGHPGEASVPTLAWVFPAIFPAVGLLGVIWALILRATKRDVYNSIGLGANTVTGVSTQSTILPAQYTAQHGSAQREDVYR